MLQTAQWLGCSHYKPEVPMNIPKVHKCLDLPTVFVTSLSPFLRTVDSDLPAVRRAYWCQKWEQLQFSLIWDIIVSLANSKVCTPNSWGTPWRTRGPLSSGLGWWQHEAPQRRTGPKVLLESLWASLLLGGDIATAASGQPCHFFVFKAFRDVVSAASPLGLSEGRGALLVNVVSPVQKGQRHVRP